MLWGKNISMLPLKQYLSIFFACWNLWLYLRRRNSKYPYYFVLLRLEFRFRYWCSSVSVSCLRQWLVTICLNIKCLQQKTEYVSVNKCYVHPLNSSPWASVIYILTWLLTLLKLTTFYKTKSFTIISKISTKPNTWINV